MISFLRSHRLLSLLFAVAVVSEVGCAHPSAYRAPVGQFRDASAIVIQATKVYLVELNKTERDMYINAKAGEAAPITFKGMEEVQGFSKEAIVVRLNALDQLANYCDLLNQLANSDAPDRIKAKATDLQTALNGLTGEVHKLDGPDDAKFKGVADRVLPLIGDALQAWAEGKMEEGLRRSIQTGGPAVNELIQAISVDVELAFQRKRTAFSADRRHKVEQYNQDLANKADSRILQEDARAIIAQEDRWELFLTANPTEGLAAMQQANDALIKFARNGNHKINDFGSFVDAVETFVATANRVGKAAHELTGR